MAGLSETRISGVENAPLTSLIVSQAKNESLTFFGVEKSVMEPPQLLLQTLEKLKIGDHRLTAPEAVFIPQASLESEDNYPGWKAPLNSWYYKQFNSGQIKRGSPELSGKWMIVDGVKRPDYSQIKKWKAEFDAKEINYHDSLSLDAISLIIQKARETGKIRITNGAPLLEWLPITSRFGVSAVEQDEVVFPELIKALGLAKDIEKKKVEIRRPTLAELNYLGHLTRFSHLGNSTTSETVEDVYRGIIDSTKINAGKGAPERSIISGNPKFGGLSQADYILLEDHVDDVSFRPVIVFK